MPDGRINKGVIATAFATFIAFMGIGVVDPLLPLIGKAMGATPYQVEWLFTSYIAVMALSMLITAWFATHLGSKRTLMLGLGIVVIFSTLSGLSPNISVFAIFRGGWGLGNALFTSTALTIIVGMSSRGIDKSITLYEAALGLGIASGPLLGGFLGSFGWRYPFFGTASLMAAGLIFTTVTIRMPRSAADRRSGRDIIAALRNRVVYTNALIGLGYSYGFFTILAYTPLTLAGLTTVQLGITYFLWGVLVAISSVVVVNRLRGRIDTINLLVLNLSFMVLIFLALAYLGPSYRLVIIVASGFFCGISNALFTTLAMEVSPFIRPVSSAAYNFLRWSGAAIAPIVSGYIGETYGLTVPFYISGAILVVSTVLLAAKSGMLRTALEKNSSAVVTETPSL